MAFGQIGIVATALNPSLGKEELQSFPPQLLPLTRNINHEQSGSNSGPEVPFWETKRGLLAHRSEGQRQNATWLLRLDSCCALHQTFAHSSSIVAPNDSGLLSSRLVVSRGIKDQLQKVVQTQDLRLKRVGVADNAERLMG